MLTRCLMQKKILILVPFFAIFLSACSFSLAEDVAPPPGSQQQASTQPSAAVVSSSFYPMVPPDPENGAVVYAEYCQSCHGEKGLGNGPSSSRSAVPVGAIGTIEIARPSLPSEWYELVANGDLERGMPPFNQLSDRQKWDVIAYVYTLSAPSDVLSLGKELYSEFCAACHGVTGHGDGVMAGGLPASPSDFTDQEWMSGLSMAGMFEVISNGAGGTMPAFSGELSEDERWALTAYLRSLTFAISAAEIASSAYPAPASSAPAAALPEDSGQATPASVESSQAYPEPAESLQAYPEPVVEVTDILTAVGSVRVELLYASGEPVTSAASVTLYGFDNMQNTYSQTLSSGEAGVYTFENVEMPVGRAFIVGAEYAGGTYGSEVMVAEDGASELTMQVQVYESSSDASVLTTDRLHIFLDFAQEGLVQVVEVFVISNPSNFSIVPAEPGGPVVTFLIPEAATNLLFQDGALGERYLEVPGGFADTVTVQPGAGQYQVVFAYNLPYPGKLDFSQTMSMQVDAVVIMLPDTGVKVKGEQVTDEGTRDMQDSVYHQYSSLGVRAGRKLQFSISGSPKTGAQPVTTSSTQNIAIGLGVFGVALVGSGIWLYLRNRKQQAVETAAELEGASPSSTSQPELQDPDTLMDAIIALDDLYRAGKLPEEAYLQRRDELKAQLKQAMDGHQG